MAIAQRTNFRFNPGVRTMLRFVVGRLGWAAVTLSLFVTVAFFFINTILPYDYATQFWFMGGSAAVFEVRTRLGLDRPLWEQYFAFLANLTSGGLGTSFSGAPVSELVLRGLPMTLLIFATGAVVAFLLGDWLGRVVAWHRRRLVAATVSTVSVLLYTAFPPWLVFLLVYFATTPLLDLRRWLRMPIDSQPLWRNVGLVEADVIRVAGVGLFAGLVVAMLVRAWARRRGLRWAAFLAIPAAVAGTALAMPLMGIGRLALDVLFFRAERSFAIGYGSPLLAMVAFVLLAFGEIMFVVRTGVANEMEEDYVLTAKAKGLGPRAILDRHVARNAVLPVLSRSFSGVPYILTGLIVIEREFGIPGLSSVFFSAVGQVDTPVILGILVMIGVLALVLRLVLDILHALLDPRIKLEFQR